MLIFGHTGLTLGTAVLLNDAFAKSHFPRTKESGLEQQPSPEMPPTRNCSSGHGAFWLTSLANRIDVRLLVVGSLLPDIMDKPIGQFFFRDAFSNGRIFCHTLLFSVLISFVGLYLYHSYGKTWFLVLSFGTFTHLIFDQMWLLPQTLFWPLYGFAFDKIDLTHWTQVTFYTLWTDSSVYVPELLGAAILIWFVLTLVRKRKLYAFIRNGRAL